MSSVSNGLYFLTLPPVSVMRVIYRKIRHALYLYIKRNVEKVWGARYTLGALYLSKNTVIKLLHNCLFLCNSCYMSVTFINGLGHTKAQPTDHINTAEVKLGEKYPKTLRSWGHNKVYKKYLKSEI